VLRNSNIRFENALAASNIESIADMEICWTNNLAGHLRLVDDYKKIVAIIHHATFLECQNSNPLFPSGLINEMLRTLALLFPKYNKQIKRWSHALPPYTLFDQNLMHCEELPLDDR
jgi:hypothetical protein